MLIIRYIIAAAELVRWWVNFQRGREGLNCYCSRLTTWQLVLSTCSVKRLTLTTVCHWSRLTMYWTDSLKRSTLTMSLKQTHCLNTLSALNHSHQCFAFHSSLMQLFHTSVLTTDKASVMPCMLFSQCSQLTVNSDHNSYFQQCKCSVLTRYIEKGEGVKNWMPLKQIHWLNRFWRG